MNDLDRTLPEEKFNLSCKTVRKNHTFYWQTKLSFERMCEISRWIGNFSPEERKMLDDLLKDEREETSY